MCDTVYDDLWLTDNFIILADKYRYYIYNVISVVVVTLSIFYFFFLYTRTVLCILLLQTIKHNPLTNIIDLKLIMFYVYIIQ